MTGYRYERDGLIIESLSPMTEAEQVALVADIRAMRAASDAAIPATGPEADDVRERFGDVDLRRVS